MTEKKLTKAQKFAMLRNIPGVAENTMLTEFIDHELELLAKKNATEKKPTANQLANENFKATILSVLSKADAPMTITDISKADATLGALANQRITAIVRQMVVDGSVVRTEDKRKAYFSVAVSDED